MTKMYLTKGYLQSLSDEELETLRRNINSELSNIILEIGQRRLKQEFKRADDVKN